MYSKVALLLVILGSAVNHIQGHGRLIDPPSRASAWRYGFNTPANYNDNQLYCGGKQYQWEQQGGRCGVCGDPWGGSRDHEAGGPYATGTIVRNYNPGQVIQVKVDLTANHKGWFEFRLCPNNNPRKRVTQSCLDRHKLRLANGGGTRLEITTDMRMVTVPLRLPRGLTCTQCVLQWKYNTGNSWGTDSQTSISCVGCGPQEQFYGCADISIGQGRTDTVPTNNRPNGGTDGHHPNPPIGGPDHDRRPDGSGSQSNGSRRGQCVAAGAWAGQSNMDRWCVNNCAVGNCPSTHCRCQ